MTIWNQVQSVLRRWRSPARKPAATNPDRHLLEANRNLRELIEDTSIPAAVREELSTEFEDIAEISRKLREGEIHIAAFGRVGVGKSSLLNALLRREAFSTSPLHGETTAESRERWDTLRDGHVVLIDTPGIDELDGQEREQMARQVSRRADITLMLCEGDLTDTENQALRQLCAAQRTVLLVLNKADRYTSDERELLVQRLRERCSDLLPGDRIIPASARPAPETVIRVDAGGVETEYLRERPPELGELRERLWSILENEGQTLSALNAAIFASELDEKVASRIVTARKAVAEKIIRKYCIGKGLLVALNPVPITDLLAAAGGDVALVIHLGEVYGFRLSRREASRLLLTISAQLVALMGAYWGMNLVSSALKTASAGLSTALTATAQGALAWYATYLTGKMAQTWFSRGKSWGNAGPKETARDILASLDRDSILRTAREDILARLKGR
ncbi:MAG: GTP-binding protein [Gammaproteobacteria bacterium]|nr:GTP-binding protein [Gammaproteobacteria bacterium]